jgi:hypothetical protein
MAQGIKDNGTVCPNVSSMMDATIGSKIFLMDSVDEVVDVALHCAEVRHHFDPSAAPIERAILLDSV